MVVEAVSSRGYEIIAEIGAGGFGVVYQAHQPSVGRDVAIKVVLPEIARDPLFVRRFEQEARLAARLEHPNIVPLYDYWQDEERAYLVMRWMQGGSLSDALKDGPLEPEAAIHLVEQVSGALDTAHKRGVVHRDLKPSNILLDEDGNAYLSDFGIAMHLVGTTVGTPTGAIIGSPAYMAPEQITGEEVTTLSDLYSLGVVLYVLLTGETPFGDLEPVAMLYKQVHEPIPLAYARYAALPAKVDTVLQKATAKPPAERYKTASDLSRDFGRALIPSYQQPKFNEVESTSDLGTTPELPAFLQEGGIEPELPVFVSREYECGRLHEFLNSAGQGNGLVAFVAGDAGSGKTSLISAFARQEQEMHPELLVVKGDCNAFSGQGDPYLPFRDALRMLTGDVESRMATGTISRSQAVALWGAIPLTARAITQHGPDLVGTFVPGSGILSRTIAVAPDDPGLTAEIRALADLERTAQGDIEKGQLFEQVSEVLRALAQKRPLLLLLDDMQWADSGSINLLFHLGRRLAGSRTMVVAAYRPEEVALGRDGERHPLQPVLDEFKREFGDVWIDLNEIEGDDFVEAFLDSEPNRLSQKFRETLYQHTQGHALFTVELLRDLQEDGDLVQDDGGYWVESPSLNWESLPARVEGVIEARIGRLEDELREILAVAAVEGEDFTVQVVARVQQLQERQLLRTLSQELERRHQLVRERQGLQLAGQYLSRYRFAHALFQRYLYNEISEGERRLLHGEVARILEELYDGRLEEITVQLAGHYVEAGNGERATPYLLEAGDRARLLFAYREAANNYRKAVLFLKEQGQLDLAAKTLMKLGLAYHSDFEFEKSREAYDEAFALFHRIAGEDAPSIPPAEQPLRMAFTEPLLDHGLTNLTYDVALTRQLFSGLLKRDVNYFDVLPDIAVTWEVLEGGRRYVFHLRDDVHWSDGKPLTAHDFEYAWKRILDPDTGSPNAELLYDLRGARAYHQGELADPAAVGVLAQDDSTLIIDLEGPTGYFLHLLSSEQTFPVPKHAVKQHGRSWTDGDKIVTNGAFRVESRERGKSIVMLRDPDYHGPRRGNIMRVEISILTAEEWYPVEMEMYFADHLDVLTINPLPPTRRKRVIQQNAGEYLQTPQTSTRFIQFDASRPPYNDRRVRIALAMAIDRESLANVAQHGYVLPATGGFIPPGIAGHSVGINLPYDPVTARRLLADAGYPDGRGFPKVQTVLTSSRYPSIEYIATTWRDQLGLDVTQKMIEEKPDLRFHIWTMGWMADYPDPDNFMRASSVSHVAGGQRQDEYDELVERARRSMNQEERLILYKRADKILVEEAVIVTLTHSSNQILVRPWLKNVIPPLLDQGPWMDWIIGPHKRD